ncbi:ABC transporter substrate-binding protein [Amnibacterium kyonggiense]|uniref:Thiamine pyrimidine synthase n=1 Tax=Amnibacterium kyonggiense TaxID=595671 RepID=A0A4R7FFK0_9MICO|nr:ABC transporter substrate-binding protein [Amnibacterium kyonggiense]TDS76163.1 ABC-type nitrate/sulfonate/bicarbonate transport system substrate-binding protein [Amnibacterium kyonggiense]
MPNSTIPAAFDRRAFLRFGGVAAGAVGTTALLAACSGGDSSTGASGSSSSGAAANYGTIAIQLSWIKNIEFAGEFFATENGYYEKAGFDKVDLLAGGSGSTTAEEIIISGKALVGLSAPIATAPSIIKGAPLKVIGTTYQKNPFCLMSLEDGTPIRTVADLKGKKLGVQAGANQTIIDGFLKANGIAKSDVTIVTTGFDIAPLVSGKYDAHMSYITNEPILAAAEGHKPVVLGFADNGLPFVAETFTVLQDTIDSKRPLLKAFLKAEIQGWTDAVKDPAKSAELAANKYGKGANFGKDLDVKEQTLEAEAQNGLILTADVNTNGLFTMTQALIDENIKSLAAMGYDITADKLFDLSLLDEVYKENPDLKTTFTIPSPSAS